jgi:2,3-bisphosphoglycerate-independent phosphoglycerate mutase
MKQKILFIIIDGGAEPKGSKSALHEAGMHHLNHLAAVSERGLWSGPSAPNYNPKNMSSVATLQLLGYYWRDEPGRGYLEALGIGIKPEKNAVYFRANFCTVDGKMKIIDRRAGRDYTGLDALANLLNQKIKKTDGTSIKLMRSVGHRNILVVKGRGLEKNITDGDTGSKKAEKIRALDRKSKKLASVVNKYLEASNKILSQSSINKKRKMPANFLLVRAPGSPKKIKAFSRSFGLHACSVSSIGIVKGISRYLGMDVINFPGNDIDFENNLSTKTAVAKKALKKYDFVVLHINGADICSHDRDFKKKVAFLKKTDEQVFSQVIKMKDIIVCVVCDHATSSKTGEHIFGPVPFMIYLPFHEAESIGTYDEMSCKVGFVTDSPMKKLVAVSGSEE